MSLDDSLPNAATGRVLAVTPDISINRVAFDAPWDWLAHGWRDLWSMPSASLTYGGLFAIGAALLSWGATQAGAQSIILALAGGFLLIGPLVAVGFYEASRRLATGQTVGLGDMLAAPLRARGQLPFMGVVLLLIFMVWMQLAFLLFMLFSGANAIPPASEFVSMLFFTPSGVGLLFVGTAVGAALAALVFAVAAISVPLLMVKDVDVATAIGTSFKAVIANPQPMMLWAALIAGFMALGVATLFIGLIVAFPLVGHATWHAFRQLVNVDGTAD